MVTKPTPGISTQQAEELRQERVSLGSYLSQLGMQVYRCLCSTDQRSYAGLQGPTGMLGNSPLPSWTREKSEHLATLSKPLSLNRTHPHPWEPALHPAHALFNLVRVSMQLLTICGLASAKVHQPLPVYEALGNGDGS